MSMVKCAASALMASIEIYNKPNFEYREQAFSLLASNAWELLLKAKIVHDNNNKLTSIYRRERNSTKFVRNNLGHILSISMRNALAKVQLPSDVRGNIEGLTYIRNETAHMGLLSLEMKQSILQFGTASVHNFIELADDWFGYRLQAPYLLPLGFVGPAQGAIGFSDTKQKKILEDLEAIATQYSEIGSSYSVIMRIDMQIGRVSGGGGSIGITDDPSAPAVRISDDEALQLFPTTYKELVQACRSRYVGFKQNGQFNYHMKQIKADPRCSYERKLDPSAAQGTVKVFYNAASVFDRLDLEHPRRM